MAIAHASQLIVGTVGSIYDLRTVGKEDRSVIDVRIAYTPSRRTANGEWENGETYWVSVTAWGRLAENIHEGWKVGDRVFVYGRTDMNEPYTNRNGVEVEARPYLVADFAGHDNNLYPSTQDTPEKGNSEGKKQRPKKVAKKQPQREPDPIEEEDLDDDLDFDLDDDISDDLPF